MPTEQNLEENNQADLLALILGDLEDATSRSGGGGDFGAIGLNYLQEGTFTARIFFDHNKKLFAEGWVYKGETEITDSEGKKQIKKIRAVTPKDADVLRPLSDLLDDWKYNAQYTALIFADVLETDFKDKKADEYFKKGLCRLVVNKKFLAALNTAILNLAKRDRKVALEILDPSKESIIFAITVHRGNQGTVTITPDFLAARHQLTAEQFELIKDVSDNKWALPKEGPENDACIVLLQEYFKKILDGKNGYTAPDTKKKEALAKPEEKSVPLPNAEPDLAKVAEVALQEPPKAATPVPEAAKPMSLADRMAKLKAASAASGETVG